MTLLLRRKHQITAPSIRRAKGHSAGLWATSLAAALAVTLTAVQPCQAELKTDTAKNATAKSANTNLKWRSPKKAVTTESAAADATALGAFADEPAPVAKASTSTKDSTKELRFHETRGVSSSSLTVKSDASEAVATASKPVEKAVTDVADNAPAELVEKPVAKPLKVAKARAVTVKRLGDAEPSSHSLTTSGASGSSLTIKLASHEEPQIDPFGDDEAPALEMAEKPARPRAVQAMMQNRSSATQNPFGDEDSKLERVPSLAPPAEAPMEPSQPQELAQALPYNCPTPREFVKKLSDISTNIAAEPGEFPVECGLGDEQFSPRNFQGTLFAWKASSLCHKPLYFEDVELERYGQTCSPLFQPIISAAKFYLTLPILPYMMGLEPPCECIYPLGYYRPGSCAPFIIPPVPISLRGALLEAGVWVAGVALVP
jgi:hypothetical protein